MNNIDSIILGAVSASFNRGVDYTKGLTSADEVDKITDSATEELRELVNTLLGESIRDTNNSDEAIAMFRGRIKEL